MITLAGNPRTEVIYAKKIIQLRDGIEEKWLMEHLTCIIEGDHFRDQFPYIKEGVTPRAWGLESHNDWIASLTRRGEIGWNSEGSRVEYDTLMVSHRYCGQTRWRP